MNACFLTAIAIGVVAPAPADRPGPDVLAVTASMPAALSVGDTGSIRLELALQDGWSAADSGMPKPILQIDVPPSVTLEGKVLEGHRELSRSGFLEAPYERHVDVGANAIGFTLSAEPAADEVIGLNVVAYVSATGTESGDDAHFFVRRRYEIPVAAGAAAVEVDPGDSSWGASGARGASGAGDTLDIGEKADDFTVLRADGSEVSLSKLLDANHVLVTTYRAFW